MTPSGFLRTKLNLFLKERYTKQSNREEICENNIESAAKRREQFKSLRNNLKHFLTKSANGREKVKVDKTGRISFKAFPYDMELTAENKKLIKHVSEKVQNKNIRFVPVVRKVSARAKEDLKELEEMMKQLEIIRKKVIKWSRV